jgi:hypothetical protein
MLDDILATIDPTPDADAADHALSLHEPAHAAPAHHPMDGQHLHIDAHHALILPPGADAQAQFLALPDPLTGMSGYGFEGFTFDHQHGLVDLDGDGVPDHTCWGTRVIEVEPYMRADGTWVEGHFRTVPDGFEGNNLGHFR